jgi:nicotinamidase/pyrazinamidase
MKFPSREGLIVVDVQNDFCAGGPLAVPDADSIIPVINTIIPCFDAVIYTKDWHPASHISFSMNPSYMDMSWPVHCVAGTDGAQFHPKLRIAEQCIIIYKGTDPSREAYSAFSGTHLEDILSEHGIRDVYICGLATDYCVKQTALDAVDFQFRTFLITDAIRGVSEKTSKKALRDMNKQGISPVTSEDLLISYALFP